MKETIVITGGTGLIGSRLAELLDKSRYDLRILSRNPRASHENKSYFYWDPMKNEIDEKALKGCDGLILLAGAGIADKRWTPERKKLIIESRVLGNELVAKSLKKYAIKPKFILAGSAIGFYGNRADEVLEETSSAGDNSFLSESTVAWEQSIQPFDELSDRLSVLRIGIVLSTKGGALEKMLLPLRIGISGYFGNGRQYYSWIHIDDLCSMMIKMMQESEWIGIFNGVSPDPIQLKDMATRIKKTYLPIGIAAPVPAFFLRLVLGEMVAVVMNSTRVLPKQALRHKFQFEFVEIEKAVDDLIKRKI